MLSCSVNIKSKRLWKRTTHALQNFRDEVDHLVDEVKGYTKKDHEQKKKEVDEAFGKGKEQESGR